MKNTHINEAHSKVLSGWTYLWATYKENGGVPKDISDAISILQGALVDIKVFELDEEENELEQIRRRGYYFADESVGGHQWK